MNKKHNDELKFATSYLPFSSDPMMYDYYIHHYAFTSVFAGLVSSQKVGEITPLIAESWSNANDFKTWHFKIKKQLTYSNGDIIKPEDIIQNFKRVAFIMKKTGSSSGVIEHLEGFEQFNKINDNLKGITLEKDTVTFSLVKPLPDFLTRISFGFYSIAHPSLYNNTTGEWLDAKKTISSGNYTVNEWTDDTYSISIRKDISLFNNDSVIKNIKFIKLDKIKESKDLNDIAIVVADNMSLMVNEDFEYINSPIGLNIAYARCYGCEKEGNPLQDLEVRKWFRQKFYQGLTQSGFAATKSFFPLVIQNVKEASDQIILNRPKYPRFKIITHKYLTISKLKENQTKKSFTENLIEGFSNLNSDSDIELVYDVYDSSKEFSDFDVIMEGSGIEAFNYIDTLKFMFLSKHGIQLPDITGKIKKELTKNIPDIQSINQELWDQAIIWPVRHYSIGFWINKKIDVDYSSLNLNHPATDFQFIRWK